jgi:pimeloyl-ACP methyl ester carboxylesterase
MAVAGLLTASSQANPAHAAAARTTRASVATDTSSPRPTIVLVHGGWADSGSWNAV